MGGGNQRAQESWRTVTAVNVKGRSWKQTWSDVSGDNQ